MRKLGDHSSFMKILDWAYERALSGIPSLDTAGEMAQKYMELGGTIHDKANALIRRQNLKAGSSGFITGVGGLIMLPIAIPANLASVLYIQIRMIAAIAHMGGHNLRDDKVKMLVFMCLAGNITKDFLQEAGVKLGAKISARAVGSLSERSILMINERVGFRLLAIYGGKGTVNFGKSLPLIGGVIGGTIDIVATNIIGNMARNTFLPENQ
jgi:hypothetical protein